MTALAKPTALQMLDDAARFAETLGKSEWAKSARRAVAQARAAAPVSTAAVQSVSDPAPDSDKRCFVTGNLVGTDTWSVGHPCKCANCQGAYPAPDSPSPVSEKKIISILNDHVSAEEGFAGCVIEGIEEAARAILALIERRR